jgi:dTDP-4-dehydrorhamnose reductase
MALQKSNPTILVTGSNGQLGSEIKVLSQNFPSYHFVFASRENLSIENEPSVRNFFEENHVDYCINCAAYTAVDKAESEKEKAFLINADAVGTLATSCHLHQTRLIHISTDYVYDGSVQIPLKETNPVGPLNVYGAS